MKKIMYLIIGIFLITGITAGAITLSNIRDVEINPKQTEEFTEYKITYNCRGESKILILREKNLHKQDIELEMKGLCDNGLPVTSFTSSVAGWRLPWKCIFSFNHFFKLEKLPCSNSSCKFGISSRALA